jgi:hypothetical protein
MTHAIEGRLTAVNLALPDPPRLQSPDLGRTCTGDALHRGSQLPFDKRPVIESDLDAAAGIVAARLSALSVLAETKAALAPDCPHHRLLHGGPAGAGAAINGRGRTRADPRCSWRSGQACPHGRRSLRSANGRSRPDRDQRDGPAEVGDDPTLPMKGKPQ